MNSDSQILTVPQHADYLFLKQVDESDAVYVRRIQFFHGVSAQGDYVVVDDMGELHLIERVFVRDMGHARAWRAIS